MGALFDPAVVVASRDSLEAYSKREVKQLLALNEQMQQVLELMTEQVATTEAQAQREFDTACASLVKTINAEQLNPTDMRTLLSPEGRIVGRIVGRTVGRTAASLSFNPTHMRPHSPLV
jgi:hypothetical protein